MSDDLTLLNNLLLKHPPGAVVRLPVVDAMKLGGLGRFSLGELCDEVKRVGACTALETHGLFGRKIVVLRAA